MSKGNRQRRTDLGILAAKVLCTARSSRTGKPCQRPPMSGQNVCFHHGGAAPQSVAAARRRLMASSDRVGALLLRIAEDEKTPPAVRLAAIRDVLDRAGVTVKQELEITVQPWQQIIDGIVAEVPDSAMRAQGALDVGSPSQHREWVPGEIVEDDDVPLIDGLPVPQPPTPTAEVKIPSRRQRRGTTLSR